MLGILLRPFYLRFSKDRQYYRMVYDIFGFIPHNIELYKVALIHRSASVMVDGEAINNERLEFLGDAVIETVTSDYLFIAYPRFQEGELTKLRSKIVSRQSLNAISEKMGLSECIICNQTISQTQKHIYGDAFEAMMGAIYLDQGYDFVNRLLINDIYTRFLDLDQVVEEETDFKSRLIEWGQKSHHRVLFKTRPVQGQAYGTAEFKSTILIDGLEVGHGLGASKKEAEQNAARSLTTEVTDEDCARILDKSDKIK